MYKVFINNSPLTFQKSFQKQTNLPKKFPSVLPPTQLTELETIIQQSTTALRIKGTHPFEELKLFFSKFNWIEAAGGIVCHSTTQNTLLIYRNNKWDLPKGKVEKGETAEVAAIREVQEECGLKNIQIHQKLSPTFHAYYGWEKYWIKKTHWYLMTTEETETTPQLEEDITAIKWASTDAFSRIKETTYASLIPLMDEYLKSKQFK